MSYSHLIAEFSKEDPGLIEAWLRLKYRTLDGISRSDFKREVAVAEQLVAHDRAASVQLADSYGLRHG